MFHNNSVSMWDNHKELVNKQFYWYQVKSITAYDGTVNSEVWYIRVPGHYVETKLVFVCASIN